MPKTRKSLRSVKAFENAEDEQDLQAWLSSNKFTHFWSRYYNACIEKQVADYVQSTDGRMGISIPCEADFQLIVWKINQADSSGASRYSGKGHDTERWNAFDWTAWLLLQAVTAIKDPEEGIFYARNDITHERLLERIWQNILQKLQRATRQRWRNSLKKERRAASQHMMMGETVPARTRRRPLGRVIIVWSDAPKYNRYSESGIRRLATLNFTGFLASISQTFSLTKHNLVLKSITCLGVAVTERNFKSLQSHVIENSRHKIRIYIEAVGDGEENAMMTEGSFGDGIFRGRASGISPSPGFIQRGKSAAGSETASTASTVIEDLTNRRPTVSLAQTLMERHFEELNL